jgi:hypothetical protein
MKYKIEECQIKIAELSKPDKPYFTVLRPKKKTKTDVPQKKK